MQRTKYRKRYVRDRQPVPFRLQDADVEVLKLLYEYRFLNVFQIQALRPRGIVSLRDRLRRMFHAGLVDRPRAQRSYLATPGPMVYALGNKGADVLAERGLLERGKVDWAKKNSEAGRPYLEHTLMVNAFRVVLTLASQGSGISARLVRWTHEGTDLHYSFWSGGERLAIRPDGFFTLEVTLAGGHGLLHFCLEADRSTESRKRFQQKLRGYWAGRQSYQEQLGVNAPFRVLTVTLSEARRDNLVDIARELGEAGQSERFLFACESDYGLENPQSILGPIWRCPRDDSQRSLIGE